MAQERGEDESPEKKPRASCAGIASIVLLVVAVVIGVVIYVAVSVQRDIDCQRVAFTLQETLLDAEDPIVSVDGDPSGFGCELRVTSRVHVDSVDVPDHMAETLEEVSGGDHVVIVQPDGTEVSWPIVGAP